jgi:hypothetical protein
MVARLIWEPCKPTEAGEPRYVALTQGEAAIALTIRTDGPRGITYETLRARWQ